MYSYTEDKFDVVIMYDSMLEIEIYKLLNVNSNHHVQKNGLLTHWNIVVCH